MTPYDVILPPFLSFRFLEFVQTPEPGEEDGRNKWKWIMETCVDAQWKN